MLDIKVPNGYGHKAVKHFAHKNDSGREIDLSYGINVFFLHVYKGIYGFLQYIIGQWM